MRVLLRHQQHHVAVDLQAEGDTYRASIDGTEHVVEVQEVGDATLIVMMDGQHYRIDVARNGRDRLLAVRGEVYHFVPESGAPAAHRVATVASPQIIAPMPGRVLEVLVRPGDPVAAGDGLLILEAMKMETRLLAEAAGTVREVRVTAGDMVEGGQVLAVLRYDDEAE